MKCSSSDIGGILSCIQDAIAEHREVSGREPTEIIWGLDLDNRYRDVVGKAIAIDGVFISELYGIPVRVDPNIAKGNFYIR